ncbi:hypothetical protein CMI37_08485 [Candidatus Pacearchaeota archaeon]|jgi:hypothetical protein|nr:hypothetical protein [Candidatus Pacearchaeota archaeon]|tara:strand:+ start:9489 stop:9905 length:417 start_codon:yes stop_codon:yes gene_type:complete
MGLEAVGTGLKTVLSDISGLRIFAPNELPDGIPELPCCLILHAGTKYNQSFGGTSSKQQHRFRVKIALTKQDTPSAFNKILDYLDITGSYSVYAKIEADTTLDGSCSDSWVIEDTGQGGFVWGGVTFLGTEFLVEAWE